MNNISTIKFVLISHVDFGKTTICAHLLKLVGYFNSHSISKTQNSANNKYKWSALLDSLPEETLKSKTHQYSTYDFTFNDSSYTIIDTPGHSSFIRSFIDAIVTHKPSIGLLVISSIFDEFKSGFNGGTLKEQIILAKASGINNILLVFNKMDSINWDYSSLEKILSILNPFLNSFNFNINTLHVSGYNGDGLLQIPTMCKTLNDSFAHHISKITPSQILSNNIVVKAKIIQSTPIVTSGLFLSSYFIGTNSQNTHFELPCEILYIENTLHKKIPFAKKNQIVYLHLQFDTEFPFIHNQKMFLRIEHFTLAFGITQQLN